MSMQNISEGQKRLLICISLSIIILSIYSQVSHFSFVAFDDQVYVTNNAHIQSGITWENIIWAFSSMEAGFWQPLTWLSLLLDFEIYRLDAGGYHLTNLLIHLFNAILLFLVLEGMTKALWQSAFVAMLFAVHPLNVEPVAWISSRKDLLSTFFFFMAIGAYGLYVKNISIYKYFLVLCFFILGLMAKSMVATLPVVLLCLDFWPLARCRIIKKNRVNMGIVLGKNSGRDTLTWLVSEKIPFIAIALVFISLTFIAENRLGALPSLTSYPLWVRFENASVAYILYIMKMLFPAELSIFYLHPGRYDTWQIIGSLIILAGIMLTVFLLRRKMPYVLVGWLWYLGTMAPVIGIVQIGGHLLADRYAYIPLVGLFIMTAWSIGDIAKRGRGVKKVVLSLALLSIISLSFLSHFQVRHWQNTVSIFEHAVNVAPYNYVALDNLGIAMMRENRLPEAQLNFEKAISLNPQYASVYNNYGNLLVKQGYAEEAKKKYEQALRINPHFAEAHFNLSVLLTNQDDLEEATKHLRIAMDINPRNADYHAVLGVIMIKRKKYSEARKSLQESLRLHPDAKDALLYLKYLDSFEEE